MAFHPTSEATPGVAYRPARRRLPARAGLWRPPIAVEHRQATRESAGCRQPSLFLTPSIIGFIALSTKSRDRWSTAAYSAIVRTVGQGRSRL